MLEAFESREELRLRLCGDSSFELSSCNHHPSWLILPLPVEYGSVGLNARDKDSSSFKNVLGVKRFASLTTVTVPSAFNFRGCLLDHRQVNLFQVEVQFLERLVLEVCAHVNNSTVVVVGRTRVSPTVHGHCQLLVESRISLVVILVAHQCIERFIRILHHDIAAMTFTVDFHLCIVGITEQSVESTLLISVFRSAGAFPRSDPNRRLHLTSLTRLGAGACSSSVLVRCAWRVIAEAHVATEVDCENVLFIFLII